MARKRMIHPSIWTDEGMADLSWRQQLLYIGLFSNADDDGRMKYSAAGVRLMLPTIYQGAPLEDIEHDLGCVLAAMTKTVRYEVEGRSYLAFLNYRSWQIIQRPTASVLPPPPCAPLAEDAAQPDERGESDRGALSEDSPQPREARESTQRALNESSLSAQSQLRGEENRSVEVSTGEERGESGAAVPPVPPRPLVVRPLAVPSVDDLAAVLDDWAAERGLGDVLRSEVERFRDYCLSKIDPATGYPPGSRKPLYTDYAAACRKWITNPSFAHTTRPPARASPTSAAELVAAQPPRTRRNIGVIERFVERGGGG